MVLLLLIYKFIERRFKPHFAQMTLLHQQKLIDQVSILLPNGGLPFDLLEFCFGLGDQAFRFERSSYANNGLDIEETLDQPLIVLL